MTDLIREIEQEAQQDAVQTFIKNNIWGILGGVTFAVLVAAGYLWWQGAQERQALADAGRYGTALQSFQSGNIDQGLDVLAGLDSTSNGYALLSRFEAAKQLSDAGQLDVALTQWDAIIADASAASQYRELAKFFKAMALAQAERLDDALAAAAAVDGASVAFAPKALELQGIIHWQQGNIGAAISSFEALQQLLAQEPYASASRRVVAEGDIASYIEQLKALQ